MTMISCIHGHTNCFWDWNQKLYQKLDRELTVGKPTQRRRRRPVAAHGGCSTTFSSFHSSFSSFSSFPWLPASPSPWLPLVSPWFPLISLDFSLLFLCFSFLHFSFFSFSLYFLWLKWKNELISSFSPQLWTSIIDANVAKCVAFNDISQLNV